MNKIVVLLVIITFNLSVFSQSLVPVVGNEKTEEDKRKEAELREPTVNFDKFNNITWYQSGNIGLLNLDGSIVLMKIMFPCNGNTGAQPCRATQFLFNFSYFTEYSNKRPYDYQNRNVIVLADNKRIPFGSMNVSYDSNHKQFNGSLYIPFSQLKQLVWAKDIEFLVGSVAFIKLNSEDMETLGNFYKLAVKPYKKSEPTSRANSKKLKS